MILTTPDADSRSRAARLAAARTEFDAEVTYLNTATVGLPPRRNWRALQAALTDWRAGTADPVAYDAPLAAARSSYARLVGVRASVVAVGSQVSVFAGLIAACLPDGGEVLTTPGDFTSILFPFYAQAGRGVTVREVPLERLAEEVSPQTNLVPVSAVQSADGRVADLDALHAACEGSETRVLLDTTQAVGWLPVDASRFAYTVCGGYKWLLSPRGTAYFTVRPELLDDLIPHHAGWYAGDDPWSSIYGAPLRLAGDARRFDVSQPGTPGSAPVPPCAARRSGNRCPARTRVGAGQLVPGRGRAGAGGFRDRLLSRRRRRRRGHGQRTHHGLGPRPPAAAVLPRVHQRARCRPCVRRPSPARPAQRPSAPVIPRYPVHTPILMRTGRRSGLRECSS